MQLPLPQRQQFRRRARRTIAATSAATTITATAANVAVVATLDWTIAVGHWTGCCRGESRNARAFAGALAEAGFEIRPVARGLAQAPPLHFLLVNWLLGVRRGQHAHVRHRAEPLLVRALAIQGLRVGMGQIAAPKH